MDFKNIEEEMLEDSVLSKLSALASQERIPLFLVGGYLRDLLLGIRRKDYDLVLSEEAASFIPRIEEALQFRFFKIGKEEAGTITYRISKKDLSVDLTLFQGQTINPDLQRRDFTINAIAFSLRDRRFHWVEGALEDIEGRVIRVASARSIDQDPLRMLRAIRYSSALDGFRIDPPLKQEILRKKDLIRRTPGERIKMELDQILLTPSEDG
jgi:tRNA nucleotidyltransferase/poly(A) polymerase